MMTPPMIRRTTLTCLTRRMTMTTMTGPQLRPGHRQVVQEDSSPRCLHRMAALLPVPMGTGVLEPAHRIKEAPDPRVHPGLKDLAEMDRLDRVEMGRAARYLITRLTAGG